MSQPLDLAPVGNGIIAGLFDPLGRCSWLCWPRFDGDPVFCALLGGEAPQDGFMECELVGLKTSRQSYHRNTAVLVTELEDGHGARLRITDAAPRFSRFGRSFRPPMLVRRIEPLSGTPLIRLRVRPRGNWGKDTPVKRAGSNHLRFFTETQALRVTTDAPLACLAEEAPFLLDRPVSIILGPDETVPENTESLVEDFIRQTTNYWLDWTRGLHLPFEWQDAVIRAAITLKMCAFEETGAIVAALTTSIPEAQDTQRNWDYRYCWLRDAFFTVQALNRLGTTRTMEEYIRYVTNVVAVSPDGVLRPCYPLVPSLPMPERIEEALPGFLGMGPVRVGNQAAEQVQNDVYGSVIMAAAQMFFDHRLPRPAGEPLFRLLEHLGEHAERLALVPDAGIWEYRGRERVHTFSAAMCWAGLARLAGIAGHLGLREEAERWTASARRLHATICERAFRPELNSFVESFESDGMDAALLLLPEIGFLSATDPRFLGTLERVEKRLLRDGFIYRYDSADDFGQPETAFLVCSFWYLDALAAVGRVDEARAMFGRILSCRNHLGLLAEDLDPRRNQLWGNFPQTYSHVGLILSAMRLSRSWEHGLWGG
ncbi:glycoside hydrolase family 15 protein [Roseomonas marmotae]|uniref:Glycoside hydrolase family 15 protein n=1 Tax=Roseomonas marmotae TaxID=2768161 RepID=A0ABS3KIH0_9PROT|nr:glycoside hydrolase family 15 protein [Roseomonas marmotae]MBO1076413.1 glycoside hydrolase family 15 protein [Roseomonas marmotae]QTI79383.1 glycoside hydrolase family 15 protein [Roseomonas marmotae]